MPPRVDDRMPADAQSIDAPLTAAAVFLTVSVGSDHQDLEAVRAVLADIDELVKTVGFRDVDAHLSCIVSIGAAAWERFAPDAKPAELRPFVPIIGQPHRAPATRGDLLFHIRSERRDICFEFERLLLKSLGPHIEVDDEVEGFRSFDTRDLLGFVDGTANPTASDIDAATLVGAEDQSWAGGSYVVVQKYLHDMNAWDALSTDVQERIIGRSKWDNVERDSTTERAPSHKTLTTIRDDDGVEHEILRDNMPFGRPGHGEFGTFFIGYTGQLWVLERMLQRMFIGDPPGSYDRLLDFSRAVTGATFFAPTRLQLRDLAGFARSVSSDACPTAPPADLSEGLGIGSLRRTGKPSP